MSDVLEGYLMLQLLNLDHGGESDIEIEWTLFYPKAKWERCSTHSNK